MMIQDHLWEHPPDEPEIIFVCAKCGEDREDFPTLTTAAGNEICEDCEHHYQACEDCGEYYRDSRVTDIGGSSRYHWVCEGCLDNYHRCDDCGDYATDDYGDFYRTICESCYEDHYFRCEGCGEVEHIDRMVSDNYEALCEDCGPRNFGAERNVRAWLIEGVERDGTTFGVELETMFNGYGCPFELGGYGSGTLAGYEFFSGWRAEEDCTVDAEFPSPVLSGPEGLAEIIATMDMLRRNNAYMDANVGQHVTCAMPDGHTTGVEVHRIMYAVEEAFFALTGDYNRQFNTYAEKMKADHRQIKDGLESYNSTGVAHLRNSYLVEFRLPPGTLDASQAAINVGVSQLIVQMAANLSPETIADMFELAEDVELGWSGLTSWARNHELVKLGLRILADYGGWHAGGEMQGLPYDPDERTTAHISDYAHNHERDVTLPSRREIISRMHSMILDFYVQMAEEIGMPDDVAEKLAAEASAIVGDMAVLDESEVAA
jgi:hypothetical protein